MVNHKLVPRKFTKEESSKGGSQSTEKKKLAAKIREIKKRSLNNKLTNSDVQYLLERIADPNASLEYIGDMLHGFAKEGLLSPSAYTKFMMDYHKLCHGEKRKVEVSGEVGIYNGMWERLDEIDDE